VFSASAQPQAYNWMFGDSAWLNFSGDTPVSQQGSSLFSLKSSAAISDSAGNLVIYTDGFHVWDKNHQLAVNGDSLWTVKLWLPTSSGVYEYWNGGSNSLLLLPAFGSNNFRLFSISGNYLALTYPPEGTHSGIVYNDIYVHNDTTEVVSKNNYLLKDTATIGFRDGRLCAVRHANGRDWWIINKRRLNDTVAVFLFDPYGIHGPYFQAIGDPWDYNAIFGESAVSQQGNKIAFASTNGQIDVYDFDRCMGQFTSYLSLGSPPYSTTSDLNKTYYGLAFSPSGDRLYVNDFHRLFQYDLTAADVAASKQTVYTLTPFTVTDIAQTDTFSHCITEMELAPNGKIYFAIPLYAYFTHEINSTHNHYLSVINDPDSLGTTCNVQVDAVYLGNNKVLSGLPNNPNYALGKIANSPCDTLNAPVALFDAQQTSVCQNGCVQFQNQSLNPSVAHVTYQWTFAGGTPDASSDSLPPAVCYAASGEYDVTLVATNPFGSDTFVQTHYVHVVAPPAIVVQPTNDSLQSTGGFASYVWSLNGTVIPVGSSVVASQGSGVYSVTVTDLNGCTAEASYEITGLATGPADANNVSLRPNPADDAFVVELKDMTAFTVTNTVGQIVQQNVTRLPAFTVQTKDWPAGLYTVVMKSSSHQPVVRKVIVQH